MNLAIFEPDIPQNTGAMIRICSCFDVDIDIIHPASFILSEKSLSRVAMDYIKNVKVKTYKNIDDFLIQTNFKVVYLVTKFGNINYAKVNYNIGDCFIFGSEVSGLSDEIFKKLNKSKKIFIPMTPKNRSINLANAVAICLFEAWRQNNFLIS